jgi:phosphohistidine phosphatase
MNDLGRRVANASAVLCLVRHGDAGPAASDPARDDRRTLTPRGRRQARRAGLALAAAGLAPLDVWTSRLARAVETAEQARDAARSAAPLRPTSALAPEGSPSRVLETLARIDAPDEAAGDVEARASARWLVGHEPLLSRLLAHLVGAPEGAFAVGKGTVAVVECGRPGPVAGAGRLLALVPAGALRASLRRG